MCFKKSLSFLVVLVLLFGILVPCFQVVGTENNHSHTYGDWVFDTAKGTQSKTCSCGDVVTLYGTDNKVSQVASPEIGESYYLAANAAGTVHYFVLEGSVTDTKPYSLHATTDPDKAMPVILESPVSGDTGFQITFYRNSDNKLLRIYCYDALTSSGNSGVMDTGTNAVKELNKHTFCIDEVNGVSVLRKIGNDNILVLKYNTSVGAWRILGVPEAELANEGVYPLMLAQKHTHSYAGNIYESDAAQHWQTCDCGSISTPVDHEYVMDETLGYGVCVCGANQAPHQCESTDGVWYDGGENHYQLCSTCHSRINEQDHTYGQWSFDTQAGSQTQSCTAGCGNTRSLHGTDTKVSQVTMPVVGESYYLVANVQGELLSFLSNGGYTETSPYSLKTTTTLNTVTVNAALEDDKGEFQLVDTSGKYIYSIAAGAGATVSVNYITYPDKVSFSVDQVNGVPVIRAFGTGNVLVAKFSEAKGAWRIWCLPESELENEGIYPVMLATLHTHSFAEEYAFDLNGHWHLCDCGSASEAGEHSFRMDETLGYGVCVCGADQKPHDCASTDGKWYALAETHYQLCGKCGDIINEEAHTYGEWSFHTEDGTQEHSCTVCADVQTLYGTGNKVLQVTEPVVGQSYYLAANVAGTVHFFRHGQVTDTTPCSLWVTEDLNHNWVFQVTIESPVDGNVGFQMTYTNPSTSADVRIYCYDSVGSDGIMDTGTNATNELAKHTFFVDEIDGVKVLRKIGNNSILVVKYNPATGTYRMLGVPESELANEGVYPAMLATLHEHTYTDTTYHSDELGHWYACQCGGKSNYTEHTATKWEYITVPTQTTSGSKTGVCTVCGATAVVEIPPIVAEGYYYLTGTVDGVKYYFRDKTGTESVEHTVPFSLLTTQQESKALQVNVLWDEKTNTYILSYTSTRELNIYMGDVNGSTIQKDGYIDLASSATTTESLITFYWDPESQMLYQLEGGVRYVIAFRRMTLTDGTQSVRMLAVPAEELGEDTAALQLELIHQHNYSQSWEVDAISHWQECDCGTRKNEGAHTVDAWTVEKNATSYSTGRKSGICTLCGEKIVQAIPMLTDNVTAPANGSKYYLVGNLNGSSYYFCHASGGASVTDTTPYGLTTLTMGKTNIIKIKVSNGKYHLTYGSNPYYIYIDGNGVGVTSNSSKSELVDFLWDEENKLLYQEENGVKYVLVFQTMYNKNTGGKEVRISCMTMERALLDPSVAIAGFTTQAPPADESDASAAASMPADATLLKYASQGEIEEEPVYTDDAISPRNLLSSNSEENVKTCRLWLILLLIAVILAVAVLLMAIFRNTKFGIWFFRKWNLWTAAAFVLAAAVLIGGILLTREEEAEELSLAEFTIVANAGNLDTAEELAVTIYEKYSISLDVVQSKDYQGNMGIYLDTQGKNSYGGYKYSVYSADDEYGQGIYINGSGPALETAISKWLKSIDNTDAFPFGLQESISGYEWNTEDINMTGLGFSLKGMESKELYQGVELRELQYESFGYGKVTGYAVIVESDADVELKVAAGEWNENTTSENPGKKHTVEQYGEMLTEEGYEILAITNAGFYDLNTTMTYIPWGMQIVDGYVKKEPNEDNPNNTDNWFGQTASGKYVISDTEGYYETYETTIAQGVGGGRVLMKDGKPCFSTTGADYRTVVGITKGGDLIILTMPSANYAFIAQIFMDMEVDIDCVLNLDGGGSTTLHTLDENGQLTQFICETPIEREVADAIAVVKKK